MKTIFKFMRGSIQFLPTLGLLTGLAACTDYLDEFKDEYDETFTAIEDPSSSDDEEPTSSETKAGTSSSAKLSSSDKGSEPADGSSSSGKVGSSSSGSEPLPEGVFGSCGPSVASVEMGSTVTWEFTWSTNAGINTTDVGRATYSWSFPGGSPETSTGRTSQTTYAKFGSKTAAVKVTVGDSTQEITCSTLNVSGAPITGCQCASTNVSPDVAHGESAKWTIQGCKSSANLSYKWTGATADANGMVATAAVSRRGDKVTGVSVTVSNTENTVVNVTCEDAKAIDSNVPELVASRVGPVSQYGELFANGGHLSGSCPAWESSIVQVRGMSLYWSLVPEAMEFWTEEGIATMVDDMKIEVVRAAMAAKHDSSGRDEWNGMVLEDYLHNSAQQKSFVKTVVEAAIKNDIYVIIDWHNESNDGNTDEAVKFFEYIAQEYGSYNNVIFEVWSEPKNTDMSTVVAHAKSVMAAIRKHSDNLVLVGSTDWSMHPELCAQADIQDKNYACTFEFFAASHGLSGFSTSARQAISNGVPVFATEWGTVGADGSGGINQNSSGEWVSWMEQNGISWTNWNASKVSLTSAAAFTSSATKTSLQYTTSGKLVKSFLAANPTTYTTCKGK
jgi:hypothetical protein